VVASSTAQLRAVGAPQPAESRGRSSYSDAFRRDAVEKARAANSVSQVAKALGVSRPTLSKWMADAAPPPLSLIEAVQSGDRKAYLIAMRDQLAEKIAEGMAPRDLPPNVRLLNETMRELEEIETREAEESADAASAPDEDWDDEDI
jgi:transposase-like protein